MSTGKAKFWEWHSPQTGKLVCKSERDIYAQNVYCPKCGKVAKYWEGQIDETWDGRAIDGWNYECHGCQIETQIFEVDWQR